MNIAINTTYPAACSQVLVGLGHNIAREGHRVVYNDWKHYRQYDVVLFVGKDKRVELDRAKKENPRILVGLICARMNQDARNADFLLVDSIEMREIFYQYNPNLFVYYPFLNTPERQKSHSSKQGKIILGYHGNKVHLGCMEDGSRALDLLSEKYDIELWAVYNIKKHWKWRKNHPKRCPVRHIQWDPQTYLDHLSQCDIGLVPAKIPVNVKIGRLATRHIGSFLHNKVRYEKTNYILRFKHTTNPNRVYAFSQLHVPVVAEFLPSYAQLIRDGHSGFLVHSQEGWYHALEQLIKNPQLRNEMSDNLNTSIDTTCSPEINTKRFLEFVDTIKT